MDLETRVRQAAARVPVPVRAVVKVIADAGFHAVVVGGAVRDLLMDGTPGDFDVASSATPEQVIALFPRTVPTGIKHGTITVIQPDSDGTHIPVEVTTFRTEGGYADGRRPDSVSFVTEVREDLSRRDFTVNAMALHLWPAPKLEDPFHGLDDLHSGVLRTVGSPDVRFGEDGLRTVRAARFSAQLKLTAADGLEEAITRALPVVRKVAVERFLQELRKLMEKAEQPSIGLTMMARTGLMELVTPGAPRDIASLSRTDRVAPGAVEARFAAWLWDAGKKAAGRALLDLKASRQLVDDVEALCALPRPSEVERKSGAEVRRMVRALSRRRVGLMEALFSAEEGARAMEHVRRVLAAGYLESTSELALDGNALSAATGAQGKALGELLRMLLAAVDEDPGLNTPERLLARVK